MLNRYLIICARNVGKFVSLFPRKSFFYIKFQFLLNNLSYSKEYRKICENQICKEFATCRKINALIAVGFIHQILIYSHNQFYSKNIGKFIDFEFCKEFARMSECIVLNNQGLTIKKMGFIYRISQLEKFLANSIFTNFSMIVPNFIYFSKKWCLLNIALCLEDQTKNLQRNVRKVDSFFLQKSYNFFYTKFQYISCWIIYFTQKNIGKFVKIKFARNLQRMSED